MDGDLAPLKELSALARAHDTWLMSDDAHELGAEHNFVDLQMARCRKRWFVWRLRLRLVGDHRSHQDARTHPNLFDRPAAASVAAALAALDIMENDRS